MNIELVRKSFAEVLSIHLPSDVSLYPSIVEDLICFNVFELTQEDILRAKSYQSEKSRDTLKQSLDFDSFLKELETVMTIHSANDHNIKRISQLCQRTNQFNLTTKRYFEEDIKKFSNSKDMRVHCIEVRDKFGEYGITGCAIICRKNKAEWEIDNFLLSCRILGKGIEFAFMQYIIDEAKKEGIRMIRASYIQTPKNSPAENFLSDCGFLVIKEKKGEKISELTIGKESITFKYVQRELEN